MKRRIIQIAFLTLLTLLLAGAMAGKAQAAEIVDSGTCGKNGDNLTWTLDDEGLLTISGTGEMMNYSDPYNHPVSYYYQAPWDKSFVKELVIENGVTSIGSYTFFDCKSLTSVTIPKGVISIGDGAFYYCKGLTTVTIPESVTSIGDGAFERCSGLTSMTIPEGVTSIRGNVFRECNGLTSVMIPKGVTSIGNDAFSSCTGLTSVKIPGSVTSIGNYAFDNCSSLTSVMIPEGVTSIGDCTFYECSGLTSVTIPEGVISIGNNAFSGCAGLKSILLFEGLERIGDNAFSDCSLIKTIDVPDSVNYIGKNAFSNWTSLESITLPFVSFRVQYEGNSDVILYPLGFVFGGTDSRLVAVSQTVRYGSCFYGDDRFNYNTYFPDVPRTFYIPQSLHSVCIHGGGYRSSKSRLVFQYEIQPYALENCNMLTDITIGNSVTGFQLNAFKGCTGLTSMTIPSSVTSIGESAFYGCTGLSSMTIPSSVTSIGKSAFYGCTGLNSVTIPSSVTSIGESAFYGCTSLTEATVSGAWTEKSHPFSGCTALKKIEFADGVTKIQKEAFKEFESIVEVTIPSSVTSIEASAFSGCTALTEVTIPSSVKEIRSYAFAGCSNLKKLNFARTDYNWEVGIDGASFRKTDLEDIGTGLTFYGRYYNGGYDWYGNGPIKPLTASILREGDWEDFGGYDYSLDYCYVQVPAHNAIGATSICNVTRDGNTVTATATSESPATVFCATYDANGKMQETLSDSVKGGKDLTFRFTKGFASAKVFLLDAQGKPLCESKGA